MFRLKASFLMFLVWFVILKCSENLCCISTAFDDFLSFCLLCSFQGTTLRELCSLKTRQCRKRSTSANHASPFGSRSWDVFAYDLLPNRMRPAGFALGQVSNAVMMPGRFHLFPFRTQQLSVHRPRVLRWRRRGRVGSCRNILLDSSVGRASDC